jgi:microcystin-dependent protein
VADPFTGEIRIFPYNFAPRGWAFCDGGLLGTDQFPDLFEVIGTTYGGDGETTFALPDLKGRVPLHPGEGPGLSLYALGDAGGTDDVALTNGQMPSHRHAIQATTATGTTSTPDGTVVLAAPASGSAYKATGTLAAMGNVLTTTGGSLPHNNMQPYLAFNFCIALVGVYPERN